ncbi:MAG: aminotransferase [Pseudomonadota bacterium]
MTLPLAPTIAGTQAPPVMEARRWLQGVEHSAERPLVNVSQAAPVAPPPEGLRQAMAEAVLTQDSAHLYGPVLGLPSLRDALATQMTTHYCATITADQVAITSGCNMAFTAAMATLAQTGDEVILPLPWYFNHAMWLDMAGVKAVPLDTGQDLLPDPEAAEALITNRTRAIVLVTPNNPAGVEYPAGLLDQFRDLCRRKGLALVIDETYRDFHSVGGAPHGLFQDPDWDDTVIHLYSFSKAYRLTGHRVGALVSSPARLAEVEKYLDTVAICPAQPGQIGAHWGIENLGDWLAAERQEILARRAAVEAAMPIMPHWRLLGAGAYFAYLEHPFDMASDTLAQALVEEAGVLLLPGTFFRPAGDPKARREVRVAFANIDSAQIKTLAERLAALPFPLAA